MYGGAQEQLEEELTEWKEALESGNLNHLKQETGDILFAVVNVARQLKIDPELALIATNVKFHRRFRYIESKAAEKGQELNDMTMDEMDFFWEQAKKEEK